MYSKEDCREALQKAESELGHSPSTREYESLDISPSSRTIKRRYENWNEARSDAGLSTSTLRRQVNERYFKEIDSSEVAYWVGFLFGDGSVNRPEGGTMRISVALKEGDVAHLRKFKSALESTHKVTLSSGKCYFVITSETMAEDLAQYGLKPGKTFSSDLPDLQRNDLRLAFIRGLVDADGHWKDGQFTITGSNQERFEELLNWIPVEGHVYDSPNGSYVLTVNRISRVTELKSWLYPDGVETEPALERKKPQ